MTNYIVVSFFPFFFFFFFGLSINGRQRRGPELEAQENATRQKGAQVLRYKELGCRGGLVGRSRNEGINVDEQCQQSALEEKLRGAWSDHCFTEKFY